MTSHANGTFWEAYRGLAPQIRTLARKQYRLWRKDPFHPSLHFKKVADDTWSVRIGRNHRKLGKRSSGFGSAIMLATNVSSGPESRPISDIPEATTCQTACFAACPVIVGVCPDFFRSGKLSMEFRSMSRLPQQISKLFFVASRTSAWPSALSVPGHFAFGVRFHACRRPPVHPMPRQ